MDTVRLLVSIALALPLGVAIARISAMFVRERPVFQPTDVPRVAPRTVAIVGATLIVALLVAVRFDDAGWGEFIAYLLGFAVLLLASVIDITEYRLPDVVVLPALAVGLVLVVTISLAESSSNRIRYAFFGAVLAFAVLLIAHVISPKGMGFGDVKFAPLLGLMVGWQADAIAEVLLLVLWLFLIGFAVGTVGGLVFMVLRGRNQPFPFGPFLALGTLVTVVFSQSFVG